MQIMIRPFTQYFLTNIIFLKAITFCRCQNTYAYKGYDAILNFTLDAIPSVASVYELSKDGNLGTLAQIVYGGPGNDIVADILPGFTYTGDLSQRRLSFAIKKVEDSTAGIYRARNVPSRKEYTITLYVLKPLPKPSVTASQMEIGQTGTLTCLASSNTLPPPGLPVTYSWTINDTSILANNSTLTLNNIMKNYAYNIYRCIAKEQQGQNTSTSISDGVYIDIKYGPLASVRLSHGNRMNVTENSDTVLVTCSADCNPSCSFSWLKNDQVLQSGPTFRLTSVKRKQAGAYTCKAQNTVNGRVLQDTVDLQVDVLYQPEIISIGLVGDGSERTEDDDISFRCDFDSNPTGDVTWTSEGGNDRPTDKHTFVKISYYNITASCLDTGTYTCSVNNGVGTFVVNHTKLFEKCGPRIDQRLSQSDVTNVRIKIGQELNISVQYIAYPTATVTWSFFDNSSLENKTLVDNESGYSIMNENFIYWQKSALTKLSMNSDDFGIYLVEFNNGISIGSSRFIVETERAPDPPAGISAICFSNLTANISWIPRFDGGSKQHFIIQYRKEKDNKFTNWTNKIYQSSQHLATVLTDLSDGPTYIFRVLAVNDNGEALSIVVNCSTPEIPITVSGNIGIIAGAITGCLLAIIVMVVIVVCLYRRYSTISTTDNKDDVTSDTTRKDYEDLQSDRGEANVYDGVASPAYENTAEQQMTRHDYVELVSDKGEPNVYEGVTSADQNTTERQMTRHDYVELVSDKGEPNVYEGVTSADQNTTERQMDRNEYESLESKKEETNTYQTIKTQDQQSKDGRR